MYKLCNYMATQITLPAFNKNILLPINLKIGPYSPTRNCVLHGILHRQKIKKNTQSKIMLELFQNNNTNVQCLVDEHRPLRGPYNIESTKIADIFAP